MKNKLKELINQKLNEKLENIEKNINAAQDAANNESKSSVGDKYETSRAMAQNDIAMYEQQRTELLNDKALFENIDFEKKYDQITPGALAKTSIGHVFMAFSMGILKIDNQSIMVLSRQSPLGQALFLKKLGESFVFNNKSVEILSIC